jgi:hypothetical protein
MANAFHHAGYVTAGEQVDLVWPEDDTDG